MTKLTILEYPDPRLRNKALPVEKVDAAVRQLMDDMLETMYASRGIGLAATQVNVPQRVIVMDISEAKDAPLFFANPEIIRASGMQPREEGCLSVPGIYEKVQRAENIVVRALGRDGKPFEMPADGLLGVCIQHEIDHLDGKLFVDYLSELKRQLIRRRLQKERKQRAPTGERRSPVPVA
jgi:peptide deformylase